MTPSLSSKRGNRCHALHLPLIKELLGNTRDLQGSDQLLNHPRLLFSFKSPKNSMVFGWIVWSSYGMSPGSRAFGSSIKTSLPGPNPVRIPSLHSSLPFVGREALFPSFLPSASDDDSASALFVDSASSASDLAPEAGSSSLPYSEVSSETSASDSSDEVLPGELSGASSWKYLLFVELEFLPLPPACVLLVDLRRLTVVEDATGSSRPCFFADP